MFRIVTDGKKVKTLMMEKMEYKIQNDEWDILWFDYEYYGTRN